MDSMNNKTREKILYTAQIIDEFSDIEIAMTEFVEKALCIGGSLSIKPKKGLDDTIKIYIILSINTLDKGIALRNK